MLFGPETGKSNNPSNLFAEYECTNVKTGGKSITIKIKGSFIGLITPTNTLIEPKGTNEFFEIIFKKATGEKGVQEDKKLEGQASDVLLMLTTFTTKEEAGEKEGWIESSIEGTAKVCPLASMKICTE
jgi:hypothetical protein